MEGGFSDAWSPEAREAAAQARKGHLHMSASQATGGGQKFAAKASSHAEVEHHLGALHSHVKANNLGTHNVSIENKHTGEVHAAKVSPHGIHGRTYTPASFDSRVRDRKGSQMAEKKNVVLGLLHRAFAAGRVRDQGALEELEEEVIPPEEGERGDLSHREPPPLEMGAGGGPSDDHIHIHLPRRDDTMLKRDEGFGGGGMTRSRFTDPGEGGEPPAAAPAAPAGGGVEEVLQAMMAQHEKMLAILAAIGSKLGVGQENGGGAASPPPNGDARRDAAHDQDTGLEGPETISLEQAEGEHEIPGNLEMEAPTGTTSDHIRKARDSAFFVDSFRETTAMAEILAPGISLPRFDSKAPPKKTFDCMCELRRDALEFARNTPEMRRTIEELTSGRPIARLTTDELRAVFRGAAMFRGQQNNGSVRGAHQNPALLRGVGGGTGVRSRIKTPAEMNQANKDFWARQSGTRN